MTFSPFFFLFHFSLFLGFFSLSLTLSLTAHQIRLAIRNDPNVEPIRNIQTPNPFATIPFAEPIRDDLAKSFALAAKSFVVLVTFACSSSLLLTAVAFARHRRICSLSSHLLAVVAEAWSSLPIKPQRHFGSLPHRRFIFLLPIQLPRPFDFHPHRLFAFPSPFQTPATLRLPLQLVTLRLPFKLFFFFLTTLSMRLLKLYLFIAFLFWFLI